MNPRSGRAVPHASRLDRLLDRLASLDPILSSLHEARGGGWFARLLAGVSIFGNGVDFVRGSQFYDDVLQARGYEPIESGLANVLHDLLEVRRVPATSERCGYSALIDYTALDIVAAIDAEDGHLFKLYAKAGTDLGAALRPVVWEDGRDRVLDCARRRSGETSGSPRYTLSPIPPPTDFFGNPKLDWYVDRLRVWAGADGFVRGRIVLIKGPSGVGKSLLARNLVAALRPDLNAGALIVTAAAMEAMDPADLIDFVRLLRPVGLIVNDALNNDCPDEDLAFLEALHDVGLTILTEMTSYFWSRKEHAAHRATGYGLRPGRIDEVFPLDLPDDGTRRALISQSLKEGDNGGLVPGVTPRVLDDLVKRTEALPGAHIVEVCRRIRVHGVKSWRKEVASVEALLGDGPKRRRRSRPTTRQSRRLTANFRNAKSAAAP